MSEPRELPAKDGRLVTGTDARYRRCRCDRYDAVLAVAAEIAWRGVETLEEQLELCGVEVRSLDDQQLHDLTESYREEAVDEKFFQAHADAVAAFARRQGLRETDGACEWLSHPNEPL